MAGLIASSVAVQLAVSLSLSCLHGSICVTEMSNTTLTYLHALCSAIMFMICHRDMYQTNKLSFDEIKLRVDRIMQISLEATSCKNNKDTTLVSI